MSNSTLNLSSSSSDEDYCGRGQLIVYSIPSMTVFSLLYLFIFCLGVVGNTLVLLAVTRCKPMHSVTNFFIVNLAASDILMCLFAVPFTPLQSFMGRWAFGEMLCKLCPFSQGVSVYVSTLTLTIIALDRYVVVNHPFRSRMHLKTSLVLIAFINALAMAFTLPYAFNVGLVDEDHCAEQWTGVVRTAYGAFTNVTQFVLPFTTIVLCYTAIMRRLRRRQRPGAASRTAHRAEADRARNEKTNRMLIAMVTVFGICWLPINVLNLLADLNLFPIYCWQYHNLVFFMAHVLAMSSTCYNPFLYAWHNDSFQKEFVKMVPMLGSVCRRPHALKPPLYADDRELDLLATTNAAFNEQSGAKQISPKHVDNNEAVSLVENETKL